MEQTKQKTIRVECRPTSLHARHSHSTVDEQRSRSVTEDCSKYLLFSSTNKIINIISSHMHGIMGFKSFIR